MAKPARGTKLQIGDGASPEAFADVADITELKLPALKAETEETTTIDAEWDSHLPTLKRGGDVSIEANWLPGNTSQAKLKTAFDSQTLNTYKVVVPGGAAGAPLATLTFSAHVTEYNPDIGGAKDKLRLKVTLKVSGAPTFV